MLYNHGNNSFHRKIWEVFRQNYRYRIPKAEREPISSEVIERYLGIRLDAYREYVATAASAAGFSWRDYSLKWKITIPTKQELEPQHFQNDYPEFHYLNHRIEPKQTYLATIQANNPILSNRIELVVKRLIQAAVVIRSKSSKTHAKKLENLLLWMINEQLTEDNRIVVRICMNKFDMPFSLWSNHGYYRNCAILLEPSLISLMKSASSTTREPEFSGIRNHEP